MRARIYLGWMNYVIWALFTVCGLFLFYVQFPSGKVGLSVFVLFAGLIFISISPFPDTYKVPLSDEYVITNKNGKSFFLYYKYWGRYWLYDWETGEDAIQVLENRYKQEKNNDSQDIGTVIKEGKIK